MPGSDSQLSGVVIPICLPWSSRSLQINRLIIPDRWATFSICLDMMNDYFHCSLSHYLFHVFSRHKTLSFVENFAIEKSKIKFLITKINYLLELQQLKFVVRNFIWWPPNLIMKRFQMKFLRLALINWKTFFGFRRVQGWRGLDQIMFYY
jgi:hypothetical protein